MGIVSNIILIKAGLPKNAVNNFIDQRRYLKFKRINSAIRFCIRAYTETNLEGEAPRWMGKI